MLLRALCALPLLLLACSPDSGPAARDDLAMARSAVLRVPMFARRAAHAGGAALAAHVPTHARDELRIAAGGLTLTVLDVDAASNAPTHTEEGIAVARAGGDRVSAWIVGDDAVEDLRIVSTPVERITAHYALHVEGGSVRLRDGIVEVLDLEGRARLRSEPAFAIDAHGERRALTLSLEGDRLEVSCAGDLAYPVILDPAWIPTGAMKTERENHAAVLLASGRLLVTGGENPTILSSTELYDPTTKSWTAKRAMVKTRKGHAGVRLTTGNVLVVGGYSAGATGNESSTEIYDPVADTWTLSSNMVSPRYAPRLTTLPGGKVLATGGDASSGGTVSTAEIYDEKTGKWTLTASMSTPRFWHTATSLASGSVLVTGGFDSSGFGTAVSSSEIFDPSAMTWTTVGSLFAARAGHVAIPLPGGKVLVAGGSASAVTLRSAEVFDPVAKTFSKTADMALDHESITGSTLPSNVAVVAGGATTSSGEIYNPVTGTWSAAAAMTNKRSNATATLLANGGVLFVGGSDAGTATATADLFFNSANGAACATGAECTSGNCVDGVCCNASCTESCKACDVTGSVGTCTAVSGLPHATRSCGAYACNAGVCRTACTADAQCASGRFCAGGVCLGKKVAGASCADPTECASSHCVDGVCCDVACSGQCQACDVVGKVGTCTPVVGSPHGTRAACIGTGLDTTCGIACNGVDVAKCVYPSAGAPCSSNGCSAGVETHASTCDGVGRCNDLPKSCGGYVCDVASCKSTCAANTDCSTGFYCKASACVPLEDAGLPCASPGSCASGACVDGVCCASASCGAGESCATAKKKGTCAKAEGTACSGPSDCGSGFCVDGVCCDSACDGQCQACDVIGQSGRCSNVLGAPHGARTACEPAAAVCAVATFTAAAACNGSGACAKAAPVGCAPYACDEGGCRTSCSDDTHCAAGNVCTAGECVPKAGATCSTDGLSSVRDKLETPCSPFRCRTDGTCANLCVSSTECAPGFTCDTSVAKCVEAPTGEPGGCAYSPNRRLSLLPALFLFAFLRRRRCAR